MTLSLLTLVSFLVFCQALGASVGAFTSVWGEISYLRAMKDGRVDAAERAYLDVIKKGLRFGMLLLLLSSFGLVITAFILGETPQPALTSAYWTFNLLALLVITCAWALSRGRMSFSLGSASIFAAWWFLLFLAAGTLPGLTFGSSAAFFVLAAGVFYGILEYGRLLILRKA